MLAVVALLAHFVEDVTVQVMHVEKAIVAVEGDAFAAVVTGGD